MLSEKLANGYLNSMIIEIKDIVLSELQDLTVEEVKKAESREALRQRLEGHGAQEPLPRLRAAEGLGRRGRERLQREEGGCGGGGAAQGQDHRQEIQEF